MGSIADNLVIIQDYLEKTNAPEEVKKAYNEVRNGTTVLMGYLLQMFSDEEPTEDPIQ